MSNILTADARGGLRRRRRMSDDPVYPSHVYPSHYTRIPIQPLDYIEQNKLGFHVGCIIKYVSQGRHIGGVDDLRKARVYADRLIKMVESAGK